MRAAPPAQASSHSDGLWLVLQQLLFAAAAAVAAGWVGALLALPARLLLPGGLFVGWLVAMLARRSLAEPPALLTWDGAAWTLGGEDGETRSGKPEPMLDLGQWMLVRFVVRQEGADAGRLVRWLPLSRRSAGPAWPALRVALHQGRAAEGPGHAA